MLFQASDLERLKILYELGGIYLDLDVFVINSFSPLRKYNFVLGDQGPKYVNKLCNGIILARPGEPQIRRWMRSFLTDYQNGRRTYNAVEVLGIERDSNCSE